MVELQEVKNGVSTCKRVVCDEISDKNTKKEKYRQSNYQKWQNIQFRVLSQQKSYFFYICFVTKRIKNKSA